MVYINFNVPLKGTRKLRYRITAADDAQVFSMVEVKALDSGNGLIVESFCSQSHLVTDFSELLHRKRCTVWFPPERVKQIASIVCLVLGISAYHYSFEKSPPHHPSFPIGTLPCNKGTSSSSNS